MSVNLGIDIIVVVAILSAFFHKPRPTLSKYSLRACSFGRRWWRECRKGSFKLFLAMRSNEGEAIWLSVPKCITISGYSLTLDSILTKLLGQIRSS